jgi:hypothetical protein
VLQHAPHHAFSRCDISGQADNCFSLPVAQNDSRI